MTLYYFVIPVVLLIGFAIGWWLKKKKIEELPSGIKEFQVEDWYLLQSLLSGVVERTREATEKKKEGELDFDTWFDSQWTLPEIRTLLYCGLKDGKLKENLDKLDSEKAFQLYLKVMGVRANRDFFTSAINAMTRVKSLL